MLYSLRRIMAYYYSIPETTTLWRSVKLKEISKRGSLMVSGIEEKTMMKK